MIKSIRILSILLLMLQTARPGEAQERRPQEVFRGLFGPTDAEEARPRHWDLIGSLYGADDDNSFLSTDNDILDQTLQSHRWYSGATISLAYTRRPPRKALAFTASTAARYYPDLGRTVTTRSSGGTSLDLDATRNWHFRFTTNATYSPYYEVVLAPSVTSFSAQETATPAADYATATRHAMLYGSSVGLTRTYSERARLDLSYAMQYTQSVGVRDSRRQNAGVRFTEMLTKDIGLVAGYGYGVADTDPDPAVPAIRNNDLALGILYDRSFSPSAGTSFRFSTGTSMISSEDGRTARLTGTGRLSQRLSSRWTAQLAYDRGLHVPEGATRPFFSDTIAITVGGSVNRRISLRAQPGFSHGVVGFAGQTNAFNSYTSTTRLEVALNRRVALYAEHFYYQYQFESGVGLPAALTIGLERQGARAGLTLFTPLAP